MAKHTSKRLLLTGIFALSSAFILSACDNIEAVPANYETPIVMKDGNAYPDDENKLGEIYDALSSNKNEKVVSALLEKIAEKEFGSYAELKAIFPSGTMDLDKARAHINSHAHQFIKESDAVVAHNDEATLDALRLSRLSYFYDDLNRRIDKVIFDEISSESYKDTVNKTEFLEEKYARAKRQETYDIKGFDENGNVQEGFAFKKEFVDNDFKEENVRKYLTNFEDTYEDYITRKIIPDVYKDRLIEEYIIDNNYSALGRAYGRKINYVSIKYSSEDPNTAYRLMSLFVDSYLKSDEVVGNDVSYDSLISWVKGFGGIKTHVVYGVIYPAIEPLDVDAATEAKLDEIYGAKKEFVAKCEATGETFDPRPELEKYGFDASFSYYEKTKLGEILKNYEKAVVGEDTRFASSEDTAQYNEFTKSGKQSKELGLMEKITELALEDYADDGWYVKNDKDGSLSSLPEDVKNRLFNIKVSNDFDKKDWSYVKGESYFDEVKGHKYLTPTTISDEKNDFILSDDSNSALHIVEIIEAPSTSKLNINSDKSYLNTDPNHPFKTEEVARQIAKILGTKDTYTTNAYTSYLKLYTFTYHDTSVYEYLKETYPDLFED